MFEVHNRNDLTLTAVLDDGRERVLFQSYENYLRNKSRLCLIMDNVSRTNLLVSPIVESLLQRYEFLVQSGVRPVRTLLSVTFECLVCDYLIGFSRPVRVGLFGWRAFDMQMLSELLIQFHDEHEIFNIDSYNTIKIYAMQSLDLLLINAQEGREKESFQIAAHLLKDEGQCLILSEDQKIQPLMAKMYAPECEILEYDKLNCVIKIVGSEIIRYMLAEPQVRDIYEDLKMQFEEAKKEGSDKDELHWIAVQINETLKKAQRAWALEEKQALIDLKEEVQKAIVG